MNPVQIQRAFVGVAAFVAAGLYPPWVGTSSLTGLTSSLGWAWMWEPPVLSGWSTRPDVTRLLIEWAAIAALTGVWVLAGRSRPGAE